jgi:MerR family copper efflux transcriptional regulator
MIAVQRDTTVKRLLEKDGAPHAELADGTLLPADLGDLRHRLHPGCALPAGEVQRRLLDERGNFMLYRQIQPVEVERLSFAGYNSSFFSPLSARWPPFGSSPCAAGAARPNLGACVQALEVCDAAWMAAFTIKDVSRRSGLSEPTLRYYEQVGLVGPIDRDGNSGHRRYGTEDLQTLEALACLRATGVGIEDMRTYQANLMRRETAAGEQRDLLLRHAERIEAEIVAQHARLAYLREKAALWDARDRGDTAAEAEAVQRALDAAGRLGVLR